MDIYKPEEKPNIAGDIWNILFLIYLYVLQCLPRGLADGISIILQKRHITYSDQAGFSLISYSYCFKLLWSPIVDCVYSKRMGRRKTWIIPTQYLMGIFLLFISMKLDDWMGSEDGTRRPKTGLLGFILFLCVASASTQDVALDAWALTMLKKRNVGHAGTCNNVGYCISQVLGFVFLILLESRDFCNMFRSVSQEHGFITFTGYTKFWSIVFIVSSTAVLIFKKDNSLENIEDDSECRLGLKESYVRLWQIVKIKPMQRLCILLMTYQIGMAPTNGVARLKLIDAGVPSSTFALMILPSFPFQIILPFLLGRFLVAGNTATRSYILTYICRLSIAVVYTVFVFLTPYAKDEDKEFPKWYYLVLLVIHNLDVIIDNVMYIALYGFFAHICDPKFGGMYITLLSGIGAIGYRWPVALSLWIVDLLSIRSCATVDEKAQCNVILDGFFVETIFCTVFGILWFFWARKTIYELDGTDRSVWIVKGRSTKNEDCKLLSRAPTENVAASAEQVDGKVC